MPHTPPNPAPENKPAPDDPLAALGAADLDTLLAEAETLAGEVIDEIGVGDAAAETAPSAPANGHGAAPETDKAVEDALAEMEAIAAEVSDQLEDGADAAPTTSEQTAPPSDAKDAMPTAEADTTVEASSEGESAEFGASVDGETAASEGAPADAESTESPVGGVRLGRLRRWAVRGIRGVPWAILRSPLYAAAGLCWVIDLPFAGLKPGLKNLLGLIGVVTAVMAAVAWWIALSKQNG